MGTVILRSLELALHFALLGGLTDVALQLHQGRLYEAIIHAAIVALAIILLAWAGKIAKKFLHDR